MYFLLSWSDFLKKGYLRNYAICFHEFVSQARLSLVVF